MPFASLRDFIAHLEAAGDLVRVAEPVSTVLEMTEIQTRVLADGGPAILFENPVGLDGETFETPVLVNLFGTVARVAAGIGRKPEELRGVGETLAFLRQPEPPGGWREAMEMLPLLKTVMAMKPKVVRGAPCQEVVWTGDDIDLGRLPIQTCWPEEPAPLITWPLVVTQGDDEGSGDGHNLGIYRMQVTGRDRTLMRWLRHRGGAQHFADWQKTHDEPMPVAAVIGADPGTMIAAVTPAPESMSEYQLAGLLRGAKVELTACKTIPLHVPAQAEIAIEGHVVPGSDAPEGYYNAVEPYGAPSHGLLQRRRALPGISRQRHHHAPQSHLHLDVHRPAAGRAERARPGAQ